MRGTKLNGGTPLVGTRRPVAGTTTPHTDRAGARVRPGPSHDEERRKILPPPPATWFRSRRIGGPGVDPELSQSCPRVDSGTTLGPRHLFAATSSHSMRRAP